MLARFAIGDREAEISRRQKTTKKSKEEPIVNHEFSVPEEITSKERAGFKEGKWKSGDVALLVV